MRNRRLFNTNTGSIHATIAIGLVVILIAALGWVFYTNFVAKEAAKVDTPQQSTTNQETPKVATVKNGVLRLEKWNVEVPIDDPILNDLTAQYEEYSWKDDEGATKTSDGYEIRVPRESIVSCDEIDTLGVNLLGCITRNNPSDEDPRDGRTYKEVGDGPEVESMVNLGQHTYIFNQRQSVSCQQEEANQKIAEKIMPFYKAFQKIRAIQ